MSASAFPQAIIARKRDGHRLTHDEIAAFVRGVVTGDWTDYQITALLMAIVLRGMTAAETSALALAMMHSGIVADLSAVPGVKVDKHSTGGVGDKVSLILAPLVAACGVPVPMMSGRGLGHTGGTLDKLESIPGFRVGLSLAEYSAQLKRLGVAMIGQTTELVPADRKLYALRDVTATVESIPLICASIMSKKLADGLDALVLDVKFGRGAFMKDKQHARALATAMVHLGRKMGKPTRALLTSMHEPLGHAVGHAVEMIESIEALKGRGPADLMEVTFALGVHMLLLGRVAKRPADARRRLEQALGDGSALAKFRDLVAAQGGNPAVIDDYSLLPAARITREVRTAKAGYIVVVDPLEIADVVLRLGGGRANAEAAIDHAVGITNIAKVGESVSAGTRLCLVHANDSGRVEAAIGQTLAAFKIGRHPVRLAPLVGRTIG
ncbi:MAG: thymidine phosphorylase [Verrucomicrobia bacterium RIFCSPLOWO2_12_FULL_64_8]|nr:MAG: thymidine phosphorylase [Verrucomicrobia bacterium RIFCSPLOWO2_12_FULL_64_8]